MKYIVTYSYNKMSSSEELTVAIHQSHTTCVALYTLPPTGDKLEEIHQKQIIRCQVRWLDHNGYLEQLLPYQIINPHEYQ